MSWLYPITLFTHSYVRWAVVGTTLLVTTRAAIGWIRSADWSAADEFSHRALMAAIDAQFTLGVIMFLFLSPYSHGFFRNFGVAFGEPTLRFFGLEHPLGMITAVSLVHFGRERSHRKAGRARHRTACLWTLSAVLLIAASIPWPFLRYGRPLLRGF